MITLQRIQTQSTVTINVTADMTLKLTPGESLLMNQSGVKTIRTGEDLVLLVPTDEWDANGKPVMLRLVVSDFFKQSSTTQVVITSDDEPIQWVTPESVMPTTQVADAQAVNSADIRALGIDDNSSVLMLDKPMQTQSTDLNLMALLALNPSAVLNWQASLTQSQDATIAVKLPGVNAPTAPILLPISSALKDPKGSGWYAINKAMVENGFAVQGVADNNSTVTLLIQNKDTQNSLTFSAKVDGSGKFSIPLGFKQIKGIPEGYYTFTAFATDVLLAKSPESAPQTLYIDVIPPAKVEFDWTDALLNLNAGYINKATFADPLKPCKFKGTAEPHSLVKFAVMNKAGLLNPGDANGYTFQTGDDGRWTWELTADMAQRLAIPGESKTQILNIQVVAVDLLGNESVALVFGNVGLDLVAPAIPALEVLLDTVTQADGFSYLTLSKKSLDQSSIFKGDNFQEPDGKVNLKLVSENDPSIVKYFKNITVLSDGSWAFKLNNSQLSGLPQGAYKVLVQGVDAAGNTSEWGQEKVFYLDVTPPDAPTLDTLPTVNVSINLEGSSLFVINLNALADTQKKFAGTAEPGSTVTLTINDAKIPPQLLVKTVVADGSTGRWSIALSEAEWRSLSEGVISCKVKSTDLSGNVSLESDIQRIYLDITAPVDPTIALSDSVLQRINPAHPNVRFFNLADFQNGTLIQGTGEKNSKITLTINGTTIATDIVVDSNNQWRYTLVNTSQKNWADEFPDGALSIQAKSTDPSGNVSSVVTYSNVLLEKHAQRPVSPTDVQLAPGEDTGRTSDPSTFSDNKTNKPAPKLQWKITPGLTTYIWHDANNDGVLDNNEKSPNPVPLSNITSGTDVSYQLQILQQGKNTYFVVTQDEWGNFSTPQSLSITLDSVISNPVFDGFQGDSNLSLQEFQDRANIKLSGTTNEDGCVVKIALFDSTGNSQLSPWVEVRAVDKTWSTANFFQNLTLTRNGSFILRFINTDEAGNTTEHTPLDVPMNIRSTPLPDVTVARLSADTDSGNNRPNTTSDNITNISQPTLTGLVPFDADADLIVRLFDSNGVQLVSDVNAPHIDSSGKFSFVLKPAWLTTGDATKFILKTYDLKTGTESGVSKEFTVTLDTAYDATAFVVDPVTDDNVINYDEFNNAFVRPVIKGRSEINSEVSLVLSKTVGNQVITQTIDSSQVIYTLGADGKEYWSAEFTQSMGNVLGDGRMSLQVTAKDRAGNAYTHPLTYFDLKRGQLTAPVVLDLKTSDDTGISDTDNITQGQSVVGNSTLRSVTLVGNTNTSSPVEVTVFNDKNSNGVLDVGDDLIDVFQQSGNSQFSKSYQLADGQYSLLNSIKDISSGQSSAPSDALKLIIDTQIGKPTDILMGNNNQISLVEYLNSTFVISGKGEANATVYLQFRQKSSPATDLLAQPWTAQVNTEGNWRLNLSKVQLDQLSEGELFALIYQKDRAGNVSLTNTTDLVYDKTPPDIPSAQQIGNAIDNYYQAQNLIKPWDRPNQGIIWTDLFSYNSSTLVSSMRYVAVPVALPTSGSLIKEGDTVVLTWGTESLSPVTVTAQDISNGFVNVSVSGDTINTVGKSNALVVKAYFSDKLNNKSTEFVVLSNVNVSLELKSPSLDVSENSQKNLGDLSGNDQAWYSNAITQFKFKGVAEPGAIVKIYAKRTDGVGAELLLTTVTADPVTGNYTKVLNLSSLLDLGVNYTIQAQSDMGGLTSVRSNPEIINVNSLTVQSPVFDTSTLGGDGYVNNQERNDGVLISGNSAPAYGKIQLKLTNLNTNVSYFVPALYANAQGKWSYTLGIIDWGVVGEGNIKVEARQSNLYGDSSADKAMLNTVKFDATVTEPLLNTVSGDNYINQLEYLASSASVIQLSGKAEPGALLTVKLKGANGSVYSPNTSPTVLSDKTWVLNLNKTILDQLGPGKVTVELSQKDLAGNLSSITQNTFFYIDLTADALSLSSVTEDNQVNDIEKDQGVALSGTSEPGAWVQITLRQTGVPDLVLPGFKANSGSWLFNLTKSMLAPYVDGTVNVQIKQTDLAGNSSTIDGQFSVVSQQITEQIVITTWGNAPTITLPEQLSNYRVKGTGPANSELHFQFVKSDGSKSELPTVVIDTNGNWQVDLTPSQMSSIQGNTTLRYWATRNDKSSSIQQLTLLIDSNFPSPSVDEVGEDGNVSLSEILATDETLVIHGTGELYSTVTVSFRGSSNLTLAPKDALVNSADKTWSVTLSKDELALLTNQSGKVVLTLVQKDNNSNKTSVAVTKSFDVDMLAPALPTISEQTDAKNFNTVVSTYASQAADGLVSDTEAKSGVDIAVPIAKIGGNFVLVPGDSIKLIWGSQTLTKVLSQADFVPGKNHVLVKVPLDLIAKEGASDNLTVSVMYVDKSGNSSQSLNLITGLKVTPPPPAPSIDIVSLDGFINKKELADLVTDPNGLVIRGQSVDTQGKVSLIFTSLQDQLNPIKTINDIVVQSNGKWSSSLSYDLLNKWVDGQYMVLATYTLNGRTSVVTKSVFEIDRVSPDAPLAANVLTAQKENALSELSGGLIRPWINGGGSNGNSANADRYDPSMVTEAAKDVLVRVAVPANSKNGDFVVLTWGSNPPSGIDNTVTQALTNGDVAKGYMSVRVPTSLMSLMGDFNGNNKLTVTAQFFDNAKNPGQVVNVLSGLDVDALPMPVSNVSTNFGDWLNLHTAQNGWKFLGSCAPNAEIELVMQGSSGFKTSPIRLWKDNNGVILTSSGQWSLSSGLDQTLAQQLGEGLVLVSIIQRDTNGNPSEPFQTSFRIDLTPPASPVIDSISKLTFSKYAEGKTISGQLEKNAVVTVYYELLNDAGNVVFTSLKKTAMVTGDKWSDSLSKQAFDDFLTKLDPGKTGAKVRVNVFQTDLAGNDSMKSDQVFQFESQPLASPVISSVSGLSFSGTTQDNVLSQLDFSSNPQITINGTTSIGDSNVHLVLQKVNGLSLTWDIAVPSGNSTWTKSIPISQLTTLGDGQYKLYVSTQVLDAFGAIDNESLPKALVFQNNQDFFTIDTNGPVCQSMAISANGINGNAKQGDSVQVVLNFSEFIQVNTSGGLPTVTLTGFSDGIDRVADFVSANYLVNKSSQMVFKYTVDAFVNSQSGNLSVKTVDWNNCVVTDLYDNPKTNYLPLNTDVHSVIVDTVAPSFTPAITSIVGTESTSIGGDYIIEKESNNVTVRVSLAGLPISELGTSLMLKWKDTDLLPYQIKTDDIANNWVDVSIDKTLLTGLDETITVLVKLWDIAGNPSQEFSMDVKVDTIKPGAMAINTWMTDDLISASEYNNLSDITGNGYEAGTTVTAKVFYLKNGVQFYSPAFQVTVNANGVWSISKTEIFNFLSSTIDYGAFELHVWQTDVHGNDSDKAIRSFFIDKDVPNKPLSIEINSAQDGWLNANEVSRLELKIVFDTLGAPRSGDKLNLKFWKYTYKQSQRPLSQTADFELPSDLVITSADIAQGFKTVTLTTSLLQQTNAQMPVEEIDFEVKIIDQGNNVSSVQRISAHLDTNIATPLIDSDPTTVVGGVTPSSAQSIQHFKGRGIELLVDPTPGQTQVLPNSTQLTIVFRSQYGNKITKTQVPYDTVTGNFDQILTPNDFIFLVGQGHTEAVVYYEVFQTDKAGNVSGKAVDSFNVSLALSPPVLQSFTDDNIVNLIELAAVSQKLAGIAVPSSTVTVKLFVMNSNNLPVQIGGDKVVQSDNKGDWSVIFSNAELALLTNGQPTNFNAYFEAVTSKSGQQSQPSRGDFQVIRSVPALSGNVVKFDANGDGANNDGLELTLTDAVLVRAVLEDLKAKGNASGKWGKNFRVDAVDSVKVNGDFYAKTFRIYLGNDHSLSTASPIVLTRTSLINVANNLPPSDLSLIPPSFFIPISINMDVIKAGDNVINGAELAILNSFKLYMHDDRVGYKPNANDTYTLFLDGVAVTNRINRPLTEFSGFLNNTNWFSSPISLTLKMSNSVSADINLGIRQGNRTLSAQINSPNTDSSGYFSVPYTFVVDTQVDTEVKQLTVKDTDGNGQLSPGDKLVIRFAEAVNLSVADLPTVLNNGNAQAVFGTNATLKAIGGVYTPFSQENNSVFSGKTQAQAQDIADQAFKSSVWEITIGANPAWVPGTSFQLSNLLDNAGNVSSSFSVQTSADVFDCPSSILIDVVSKDNVISVNDITAPVNVTVKLAGAKVGDVVKLYMDGTSSVNQVGKSMGNTNPSTTVESITVTQADLNNNSVTFQLNANDWGGDGMRNLTATIQRGNGSVVTSDMRNVAVSTTSEHWSATGKIIWFDTDNIVQETGTNVTTWAASVGGSVATAFSSANNKMPMLVRNAVNGHNQLFFNGPDFTYNPLTKVWTVDQGSPGAFKGSFMYFNDPEKLFANYTKDVPDVVPNKISYTVIANGRKDVSSNGVLTSIGANGSNNLGYNGGDFKLSTGNVGIAFWGNSVLDALQGQNNNGITAWQTNRNNNNPLSYSWDMPYLKPGELADLGYNPMSSYQLYRNGMVMPINSGNLGMQLQLSHVYDATPYGNTQLGDLSFFSNSELIGHRVTDYKIVLGGGKPAGSLTYTSTMDAQFQAIMATQFLIGAMNNTSSPPTNLNDIGKNVSDLWRGMVGDIVWAAKAIKGAALQEINTYQAVKFATVGYFIKPSSMGSTYDLSTNADKINLLDDVLLLNQDAKAGNGAETVTVAGADYVTMGNSTDTVILKDLNFRYLDGGKGEDTLMLHANFSTKSTINLSDYVSNARGMSDNADDNARVNSNGFHKLMGFETIDLSSNTQAQTLSLSVDDVWQLSDTHSLKIKMDSQDLLLAKSMGNRLQGHFYISSDGNWYDGYYAPNTTALAVTMYTQGGDKLASLHSFDLSNNNKILDLNFDHALKIDVGSTLQIGDFSIAGLGPYNFTVGGLTSTNPTTVTFNDLQQSLRFQSTESLNGPVMINYTGSQLQDTQGRLLPSYTWLIGSDLPNQDYNNYKVLNANILSNSVQKNGVMILGGAGEDELIGGLGADTLVGGIDSDTLTGGEGSDTFLFAKESGNVAGVTGDVIKDFNFGKSGGIGADTISLYHLFDQSLVSQLGKGAVNDANKLNNYLKLEWTNTNNNLQMVCSIDTTGNANFSKLFTMTDLTTSIGDGNFDANKPDLTRLYGGESTNALLQKMLEEGRLVIQ